jgi:hypothetical protein
LFRVAIGGVDKVTRVNVANNLNTLQSQITRSMLDSSSSVNYTPRSFEETDVFKSLVASAATSMDIPLTQLVDKGYVTSEMVQQLARNKIMTLGDLFGNTLVGVDIAGGQSTRMQIINKLLTTKQR